MKKLTGLLVASLVLLTSSVTFASNFIQVQDPDGFTFDSASKYMFQRADEHWYVNNRCYRARDNGSSLLIVCEGKIRTQESGQYPDI